MRSFGFWFVFGTFIFNVVVFFNATYLHDVESMTYHGIMSIILLMLCIKMDK